LTGGSYTVNASCASGTAAIGDAFRRVRSGLNPVAVTGGVEALLDSDGATMRGFDTLGTLTRAADGRPQPFSRDRSGFLFAEGGGCILILEELQHALERQAPIYAEILDHADASDACNIVQVQDTGQRIEDLCRRLAAGRKIDYFNAHGTGTVQNDEIEKTVICRLFGGRADQPAINSTKGLLGHTIGASGAIEAAVTALAIRDAVVHGNASTNMMPELNLIESTRPLPVECAMTVSYGFGGHNNGLLLERFEA
jgi:3-oxoacyl-[acyl-carrier-protein] synthase II